MPRHSVLVITLNQPGWEVPVVVPSVRACVLYAQSDPEQLPPGLGASSSQSPKPPLRPLVRWGAQGLRVICVILIFKGISPPLLGSPDVCEPQAERGSHLARGQEEV